MVTCAFVRVCRMADRAGAALMPDHLRQVVSDSEKEGCKESGRKMERHPGLNA